MAVYQEQGGPQHSPAISLFAFPQNQTTRQQSFQILIQINYKILFHLAVVLVTFFSAFRSAM